MNLLLNERYLFAGFMLDLVAGRFFADGEEVQLRPKSFALLSYMARNAGRVVSKDELMSVLWPDVTVTEDSLTQCVRDVRRALGDDGAAMLRTLPRRGYMLDIEVRSPRDVPPVPSAVSEGSGAAFIDGATADAAANAGPPALPRATGAAGTVDALPVSPQTPQRMWGRGRLRWIVMAGGIAALVLAAFAVWWTVQAKPPAPRAGPLSLAIVRFANQTGDPEKDFIATGMPINIALVLGSSPSMRLTEWWRDLTVTRPGDVLDIATDLRVDLVLDGSIGLASPGYRFSGLLHDGATGDVVTAIEAEVADGDLARMQYLIAKAVVDEVAALTGDPAAAVLDPDWGATSAEPDEYTFFLRGQAAVKASRFSGEDDGLRVIETALARYPQSVPLRLLKAEILTNQSYFAPSKDSWDNAQAAWAILSGLPEPATLPLMEQWQFHSIRAAVTRLATGDFAAGMRDAEEANRLIPHAMSENIELAMVASDAGYGARAVEWVRATMRDDPRPTDWQRDVLAWALLIDGRPEEALAEYAQIQNFCLACKVVAFVRTGRMEQARNLVATMQRERPYITIAHERNWPTGRHPFLPEPFLSAYLDDLRKAGLAETGPPPP